MSDLANFQGMPNINTPLVNADGTISFVWYNFLVSLFKKSGLGTPNIGPTQVITASNYFLGVLVYRDTGVGNPDLIVVDQNTGDRVGFVELTPL